jgi:hypothetical protein
MANETHKDEWGQSKITFQVGKVYKLYHGPANGVQETKIMRIFGSKNGPRIHYKWTNGAYEGECMAVAFKSMHLDSMRHEYEDLDSIEV